MAEDTTTETPPAAPEPAKAANAARSAHAREHTDPTERSQPIPLLAAAAMASLLVFGAGYIALDEAPGTPTQGDRRTVADLRGTAPDGKQPGVGAADGKQLYAAHCVACHQATGKGLPGVFPPLDGSEWVTGSERVLVNLLLHGIEGEISVAGSVYKGVMPPFKQLANAELAALASHVRSQWSNQAAPVAAELFAKEREANPRTTPFAGGAELAALGARAP
jgi:mono/diheme cytochrome c family protein